MQITVLVFLSASFSVSFQSCARFFTLCKGCLVLVFFQHSRQVPRHDKHFPRVCKKIVDANGDGTESGFFTPRGGAPRIHIVALQVLSSRSRQDRSIHFVSFFPPNLAECTGESTASVHDEGCTLVWCRKKTKEKKRWSPSLRRRRCVTQRSRPW